MAVETPGAPSFAQRAVSDTKWATMAWIMLLLSSFGVSVAVVRLVGAEGAAAYFVVQSAVTLGATIGTLAINRPVTRIVARSIARAEPALARGTIAAAVSLLAFTLLLSGSLLALGLYFVEGTWSVGVVGAALAACWVVIYGYQEVGAAALRGFHEIIWASFTGRLASSLALLTMLWLLIARGEQLVVDHLLALTVVAGLAGSALGAWGIARQVRRLRTRSAPIGDSRRELVRSGLPMLGASLMAVVISQMDLWAMALFASPVAVGVYAVAVRIARLAGVAQGVINSVLPPFVSTLHTQGNRDELQRLVRATATIATAGALIVALLAWLGGRQLLVFAFGDEFAGGYVPLGILVFGGVVQSAFGSCGIMLSMTGHERVVARWTSLTLVVMAVLALVLVPPFEEVGAALAAVGARVVQNVAMTHAAWRHTGIVTVCGRPRIADIKRILAGRAARRRGA